eukprot:scaffold5610_cov137-Isochrysis_galbana.AAC.12
MLAILEAQQVASHSHSCEITQSNPSLQSGMVQPVVNEMFATVHAAGSSLLGLFTSCSTFDSTEGGQPCSVYVEGWGGFSSANGEELCRACFCANASARSANRLRVYLQTLLGSKGWFSRSTL